MLLPCPRHMGYSLGAYRRAEVSPLFLSRFVSDTNRTVFRIPAELIFEILTYFGDPRRNILSINRVRESSEPLHPSYIERLTVMRKLTMTCWHLRNMLFPLLWKYVEGRNVSRGTGGFMRPRPRLTNGLYAQCAYLILNPTIGAYVQCVYSITYRWELTRRHPAGLCLWT